jgi:hypothetical protein
MSLKATVRGNPLTDEAAVRACPGGLAERGAITPAGYREHGRAALAFDLAGGR